MTRPTTLRLGYFAPGGHQPKHGAFKQALVRLHPGERRCVSLLIDSDQIAPGTAVHVAVDTGLAIRLWTDSVPDPVHGG